MSTPEIEALVERAVWHGLALERDSIIVIDEGLDYRVALAEDAAGESWTLRIPRRADVVDTMEAEAAVLNLVRPHLSAAVPDWKVRGEELIAYPALPGRLGMSLADGEPQWHMDPESHTYAAGLGRLLAELHGIDVDSARAAGVEVRTPEQARQVWKDQVGAVAAEFDVAPSLLRRWGAWIEEDSYWPEASVMTHGEIYPAHVLLDGDAAITGVLDWTTARVDDPGRDFASQFALAGEEAFEVTVRAYEEAGGTTWPRLAEHCHELWNASPLAYATFAMRSGDATHRTAAAALLNPDD